jgi:hypothetical protein
MAERMSAGGGGVLSAVTHLAGDSPNHKFHP